MELPSLFCGMSLDATRIKNSAWERINTLRASRRPTLQALKRSMEAKLGNAPLYKSGRKHLPLGTGPYTVGCADIMSSPSVEGTFIRLYYPTYQTDVFKREAQWPLWLPRKQYGKGYAYFRRKNTKVFGTLMNYIGGDVFIPVLWHAPLRRSSTPYPLVIFSHGLGGNRTTYTTFVSDLASHGFIVAVLEHRDGSASMTYCMSPSPSTEGGQRAGLAPTEEEATPTTTTTNNTNTAEHRHTPGNHLNAPHPGYLAGGSAPAPPPNTTTSREEELLNLKNCHHRHGSLHQQWIKYERQEPEDDYVVRNKQVKVRVTEVSRALDYLHTIATGADPHNVLSKHFDLRQFKGQIDTDLVSLVGHSFGGSTTIASLAKDNRFKVGVALDAWMHPLDKSVYPLMSQPLLCVNADGFHWQENIDDFARLGVNYEGRPPRPSETNVVLENRKRIMITMKGTCHQSFTDFQFLVPSKVGKMMEMRRGLDPTKAMNYQVYSTVAFLNKHLGISTSHEHDYLLRGDDDDLIYGTNLTISTHYDLD